MKERVPLPDFGRLWTEQVERHASLRMTDDEAERTFWKTFMARKADYAPDGASRSVVQKLLLPLLRAYGVESALELGPGWGNYTVDLARACRELDCVDLSPDVLDFILRIGREQGCGNIRAIQAKWEDFVPERTYDLVFGYNCFYRQTDLRDCFGRMTRAAKKLCVAGMNTGLAPVWVRELEAAGAEVRWEWKDHIYFVGVLYQMGLEPNLLALPFEKELSYPDVDALVRGECARCAPGSIRPEEAEAILRRHFTRQPDGSWHAVQRLRSGVVWWTVPGAEAG